MADPNPGATAAATSGPPPVIDERALQRQKSIDQAAAEGHDADIPSDIGYILDEDGEKQRLAHIAEQRRHSLARKRSHTSGSHNAEKEIDAATGTDTPGRDEEEVEAGADVLEEDDPNVVWWSENDQENPYNWPIWRKVLNCAFISLLTFVIPLGSSIFAPAVPQLMREFGSTNLELASFVVSVYVLGFAAGPLIIAPLSEIYGRLLIYHVCNVFYIGFTVGCALAPSLGSLIAFRFLAGTFGSCPLTNGGGSIADMFAPEKRASAMGAFSLGPLLGPIIGPVAGGFLSEAKGWRWVFWVLVILGGALFFGMLIFGKETYAPVLLQRRVDRLKKETGNELLRSKLDAGISKEDYFKRSIVRPLKLLTLSPICIIFAVYTAILYGYLYLMFTSISEVFYRGYGFSASNVGLVFLGLGVGSLAGLVHFGITSDRAVKKIIKAQEAGTGRPMQPEVRLILLPYAAGVLPIGFFIYGWTTEYKIHWIVPVLSHVLIGWAMVVTLMAVSMALVDAFTLYAASALAANTVARSIFGAVLPLCGLRMYNALGLGWGNSLLGFVALPLIPTAILIIKYGEMVRTRWPVKNL